MTGLTVEEAMEWRVQFQDALPEIVCFNPVRRYNKHKDYVMTANEYDEQRQDFIFTRDYFDVQRADLIVVNLLGAKQISIGTTIEIAWARAMDKPVLVAMETEGNPHDHGLLRECFSVTVHSLEELIKLTKDVMLP
jgi:nucleoside 2-deoxyribosyltransferase